MAAFNEMRQGRQTPPDPNRHPVTCEICGDKFTIEHGAPVPRNKQGKAQCTGCELGDLVERYPPGLPRGAWRKPPPEAVETFRYPGEEWVPQSFDDGAHREYVDKLRREGR